MSENVSGADAVPGWVREHHAWVVRELTKTDGHRRDERPAPAHGDAGSATDRPADNANVEVEDITEPRRRHCAETDYL